MRVYVEKQTCKEYIKEKNKNIKYHILNTCNKFKEKIERSNNDFNFFKFISENNNFIPLKNDFVIYQNDKDYRLLFRYIINCDNMILELHKYLKISDFNDSYIQIFKEYANNAKSLKDYDYYKSLFPYEIIKEAEEAKYFDDEFKNKLFDNFYIIFGDYCYKNKNIDELKKYIDLKLYPDPLLIKRISTELKINTVSIIGKDSNTSKISKMYYNFYINGLTIEKVKNISKGYNIKSTEIDEILSNKFPILEKHRMFFTKGLRFEDSEFNSIKSIDRSNNPIKVARRLNLSYNIRHYMNINKYTEDNIKSFLGIGLNSLGYIDIILSGNVNDEELNKLCKLFNCNREDLLRDNLYTLNETNMFGYFIQNIIYNTTNNSLYNISKKIDINYDSFISILKGVDFPSQEEIIKLSKLLNIDPKFLENLIFNTELTDVKKNKNLIIDNISENKSKEISSNSNKKKTKDVTIVKEDSKKSSNTNKKEIKDIDKKYRETFLKNVDLLTKVFHLSSTFYLYKYLGIPQTTLTNYLYNVSKYPTSKVRKKIQQSLHLISDDIILKEIIVNETFNIIDPKYVIKDEKEKEVEIPEISKPKEDKEVIEIKDDTKNNSHTSLQYMIDNCNDKEELNKFLMKYSELRDNSRIYVDKILYSFNSINFENHNSEYYYIDKFMNLCNRVVVYMDLPDKDKEVLNIIIDNEIKNYS